MTDSFPSSKAAAVVIGRNEGERLVRCIASVKESIRHVVYVDSGSSDGSVSVAMASGAHVVTLDLRQPFTAARARNAGIEALRVNQTPDYVQFIDGDCELQPNWIAEAIAFLETHPNVAVACGRRRERYPNISVYNRLCDREWDTPIGNIRSCGGDALMRWKALEEVEGFDPRLIAGEEPELCVRLRAARWEVWRLDVEMTLHDADIKHFAQWWKRARRGGYAAAEGMALHGAPPELHSVATVSRALFWGLALPLVTALGTICASPWSLLIVLAYPAQVIRLALRKSFAHGEWEGALFLTIGKFPEMLGVAEYWIRRLGKQPARLLEYK